MLMGHYATVLVPYQRQARAPLWLLLTCAMLPDFVWIALAFAGVEPIFPSQMADMTMRNFRTDMIWSHMFALDVGLAVVVFVVVLAALRDRVAALWCGGLVVAHIMADWLGGFSHPLLGDHGYIGLNLFISNPSLAFIIEAIFAGVWVTWYVFTRPSASPRLGIGKVAVLYATFVGLPLTFLPLVDHTAAQLMGK